MRILILAATLALAACAKNETVYSTPGAPVDLVECQPGELCL
jgi:uncharacterized lipoprotein YajG